MEKIINNHDEIKRFKCECGREWTIRKGDSPHIPNDISKVFTVYHGPSFKICDKLMVYQQRHGIKRYFVRKVDNIIKK